jgi:hypothetical protein
MKRVIVAGGGISGLVFNYVAKRYRDVAVTILEPGAIGGEFLSGGLKYIHKTDEMARMFDELDLPYSNYIVQGGIMLRGSVHPYPMCLATMDKDQAERIQADHYRKTRRVEPGNESRKAMNDPASTKPRKALRCDFREMIVSLARLATFKKAALAKVEDGVAKLDNGESLPFDYLVLTIPLWIVKGIVPFPIPEGMAIKLNVAIVQPERDAYAKWDYVYTPYTPSKYIHRFSPHGGGYAIEANGNMEKERLADDLQFIFGDGWRVLSVKEGLKGHLLPLEFEPTWPANIAPLGRFAKWDPRSTTDETLFNSMELAKRWFGEPG